MNQVIDVKIENMIYEVRGKQVMLDSDLARLFGYETKDLNRNVKNNINRFPEGYCFQLTNVEYESLRCKNITLKNGRGQHKKYLPYVFTEYGITMLAGILRSDIAIKMSLRIVDTFIAMKKYISSNLVNQNYYNEMVIKHDNEIKLLQESVEQLQNNKTNNGLFFEGQIYDAYSLLLDIFEQSKESIIIIDNYIDKNILDVLRNTKKEILIITNKYNNKEFDKYEEQYKNITLKINNNIHDRFIIIDNEILYHCGASFKDLGKKCFAITKIEDKEWLKKLKQLY